MRPTLCLVLLLAGIPLGACADEGNLTGGVLIAHHDVQVQYSPGYDHCAAYFSGNNLAGCEDQVNRIDIDGEEQISVWYVVAAWDEPKIWCAAEFGLGDFNPDAYYFVE